MVTMSADQAGLGSRADQMARAANLISRVVGSAVKFDGADLVAAVDDIDGGAPFAPRFWRAVFLVAALSARIPGARGAD